MSVVIKIENVSKQYRLGLIGTNTLKGDLQRWWYNLRGLPDPTLMIGQENNLNDKAKVKVKGLSTSSSTSTLDEFVWALKDINLEVQQGEVLGIIGKNGAGKSTLLKLLSRVTAPTIGNIKIKGRIASLLEVGTGFHPELTGKENIFLNGAILGMTKSEIKSKLEEIVDFAGVAKYLDTPVKRYSSGMYVRLAFAVAAHLECEILLVDEVLAVGDMEFRKKSLNKMQDVSQLGKTILFVSHDMGNISNLCPKTIWLHSGNIHGIGNSKEMISQYVSSDPLIGGEITWANIESAPGNEEVRLKAVRIMSNGLSTANVMIDSDIIIEIDYWNLQDEAKLITNIHLRDKMNGFVFASVNWPSASLSQDLWVERKRPKGIYRTVCVIPSNFLNSDQYSIDIGIQNHALNWHVWEKNLITFIVHETGEMKKEYMGSWVGVVRPKLAWSTEFMGIIEE